MRIGIVGGGAAGLVTAWLLEAAHDVTLFERDDRLGGHAQTVDVDLPGRRLAIDAGFQFFGPGETYATFLRLLDALEVQTHRYPATLTLYGAADTVVLPPLRPGQVEWGGLTPASIGRMLRVRRFLADVPGFLHRHDTDVTMGEHLAELDLPPTFRDRFLVPLLLAFWCVELDEFLNTAAYNTLYYLAAFSNGFRSPIQLGIGGGMRSYVDALAGSLQRTRVQVCSGVRSLTRSAAGFRLRDTTGAEHSFDQVVLAGSAADALELLRSLQVFRARAAQLGRFEFFDARIAIHGDRRLMPARESAWSVVNARWDGEHSQLSIWNPEHGLPVFRSWVTYEERMPDPLYALVDYRHGRGRVEHFAAQRELRAMQGEHGLWLAGMYVNDGDSHESAIRSAVEIAERLAPGSQRLALLRADASV